MIRLLRDDPISVVLNLSELAHAARVGYVETLLPGLDRICSLTGLPHWIIIDEAQYFFRKSVLGLRRLGRTASLAFVTYRPSLLAPDVYGLVGAHIIAPTTVEEERYFISSLLQARGPRDLVASDALRSIEPGRVALLLEDPPQWQVFTPAPRLTTHVHHGRKYVDTRLSDDKAFHFTDANGAGAVAHNVIEFHAAVQSIPLSSLRHHLNAGDFSRWVEDVLGDAQLARALRKLELTARAGAMVDRTEILAYVEDGYLIEPEHQSRERER